MLGQLKYKARKAARRTALGGLGVMMSLTGLGFLTASAYLFLLTQTDAITASLIMGGVFVGLGLILLALASGDGDNADDTATSPATRAPQPLPEAEHSPLTPVAVAFLDGLHQGMAVRRGSGPH